MSMDPATFANSTVNYYAMTYIGASTSRAAFATPPRFAEKLARRR